MRKLAILTAMAALSACGESNKVYVTINSVSKSWGDPEPGLTVTVNTPGYDASLFTNLICRESGEMPGTYLIAPKSHRRRTSMSSWEFFDRKPYLRGSAAPDILWPGTNAESRAEIVWTNGTFTVARRPIAATVYGCTRGVQAADAPQAFKKWFRAESTDERFIPSKLRYAGPPATNASSRVSYALAPGDFKYADEWYDAVVTIGAQGYLVTDGTNCQSIASGQDDPTGADAVAVCAMRTGATAPGAAMLSHVRFGVDETLMGDSFLDNEARAAMLDEGGFSVMAYMERCYGGQATNEIFRAVAERLTQFSGADGDAVNWNPAIVRCRKPGESATAYEGNPDAPGLSDYIPLAGAMFRFDHLGTNAVDVINGCGNHGFGKGFDFTASTIASCESNDAARASYAIPRCGVVVHTNDYARVLSRFVNCMEDPSYFAEAGGLESAMEAAGSTEFAGCDALTSWEGFVAAFRGLKILAFRSGYDVGADGGFEAYFSARLMNGPLAAQARENKEVPVESIRLIMAYKIAKQSEGTAADTTAFQELRALCESAAVGRRVL